MMTDKFGYRCDSLLAHPITLAVLLAAFLLISIVSCSPGPYYETHYGVTRVGITADGVIAEVSQAERDYFFFYHKSKDGGLTWSRMSDTELGELGLRYRGEQIHSEDVEWGRKSVDTPKGNYMIDGSDILRASDNDSILETVYSTDHLRDHRNKWIQAKQTPRLGRKELSFEPSAIVYDEQSGNLIASMGIQGVLVGTPNGSWTPVAVDSYAPSDFSRLGMVKTLFSSHEFWGTALTFPLSLITLTMFITRLRQEWPLEFAFLLVSAGAVVLAIVLSGIWLLMLAMDETTDSGVSIFAAISALSLAAAIGCSLRGRWLKLWWAILVSLLGMMAFVAFTFTAWLQVSGLSRFAELLLWFAVLAIILLCAVTSWKLGQLLIREEPSWSVTWSRSRH